MLFTTQPLSPSHDVIYILQGEEEIQFPFVSLSTTWILEHNGTVAIQMNFPSKHFCFKKSCELFKIQFRTQTYFYVRAPILPSFSFTLRKLFPQLLGLLVFRGNNTYFNMDLRSDDLLLSEKSCRSLALREECWLGSKMVCYWKYASPLEGKKEAFWFFFFIITFVPGMV